MATGCFLNYVYLSSNELTVFLCSLLAALLLLTVVQRRRRRGAPPQSANISGLPLPPCLPSLPLVGSLPFMFGLKELRNPKAVMDALAKFCMFKGKELGGIFAFHLMSRYTVIINGRKNLVEALSKTAFSGRSMLVLDQYYTNPNGLGLINASYGAEFIQRRSLVRSILRELGYGKRTVELRIQDQIHHLIDSISEYKGLPFNPKDELYRCVVGVTLGFLFGRSFESDDPLLQHIQVFVTTINENLGNLEVCPALRFWPSIRASIKRIMALSERLYELTDAEIDNCLSAGRENSFVHKYVQRKGPESAHTDELRYIIRDMYLGGSDTLLSTLRWIFSMLANSADVQQKLQKQIDDLYGNDVRLPSLDDIVRLPYVEATIQETMRKETLMAGSVPHLLIEDADFQGFFLPKGTIIIANLFGTHMDPDEWDNPVEFCPERFMGADGKLVNKDRIFPFSTGKRSCLGEQLARQQLFLITTGIVRHFNLRPPEGQSRIEVGRVATVMNEPSDYHIRMTPRNITSNFH